MTGTNSLLKGVNEIIAAAKAKPGQLTYGLWRVGGPAHIGAAMMESVANSQMSHVPYKETPSLFQAVLRGTRLGHSVLRARPGRVIVVAN